MLYEQVCRRRRRQCWQRLLTSVVYNSDGGERERGEREGRERGGVGGKLSTAVLLTMALSMSLAEVLVAPVVTRRHLWLVPWPQSAIAALPATRRLSFRCWPMAVSCGRGRGRGCGSGRGRGDGRGGSGHADGRGCGHALGRGDAHGDAHGDARGGVHGDIH